MAVAYETIVKEDLNLGHGTATVTMPGGGTATGNKVGIHTFAGGVVNVASFGAVVDGVTDDSQALIDAVKELTDNEGGVVYLPPGRIALSSTITLNVAHKALTFKGAGASVSGTTSGRGTTLVWVGGASKMVDVSGDVRNLLFEDLNFGNEGTATHAVEIDGTDFVTFNRVSMRPTTAFSTAAISVGPSGGTRAESLTLNRVHIRQAHATAHGLLATRAHDLRIYDSAFDRSLVELGLSTSLDVVNGTIVGSRFICPAANTNCVNIINARNINFVGCHFEQDGTGYAINVPSAGAGTAFTALGILGGYFVSSQFSNLSTYAVNLNQSGADLLMTNCHLLQYANPFYAVRDQSSRTIKLDSVNVEGTGAALVDTITDARTSISNCIVDGSRTLDRFPIRTGTYTDADATPSVKNINFMIIANTGATTITNFDDGLDGQVIVLQFSDSNTTVDRTNAKLAGGVNFTSTADDVLVLVKQGTLWRELSRAANS